MNQFVEFCIGVAVIIAAGTGVRHLLDCTVPKPQRPSFVNEKDWEQIFERYGAGGVIGFFERLLSLLAFWLPPPGYVLIGAWLAFKVAAKWETWKDIIQVPRILPRVKPLAWFQITKVFGSWILSRYLVGTLINILIGALGMYVGKNSFALIEWFRSFSV